VLIAITRHQLCYVKSLWVAAINTCTLNTLFVMHEGQYTRVTTVHVAWLLTHWAVGATITAWPPTLCCDLCYIVKTLHMDWCWPQNCTTATLNQCWSRNGPDWSRTETLPASNSMWHWFAMLQMLYRSPYFTDISGCQVNPWSTLQMHLELKLMQQASLCCPRTV